MLRSTGIALVKRALDVIEQQWPDMADAYMRVPLEAYHSDAIAARERELFETEASRRHSESLHYDRWVEEE